jgi:Spy/CpxP family protein refolding chaperone
MTPKLRTLKTKTVLFLLAVLFTACGCTLAARAEAPGDDPIARAVFPPDLVMKHSQEINLDERQRAAIKEQVQKAQAQATDAQFDLQGESQRLVRLLQARPVDETAVLAQVDKVLALERQVKRTQILLLVRIKNLLTEAQQAKLTELRARE